MSGCDGWCADHDECEPPVEHVRIIGGRWDGYEFDYCQYAIERDRTLGFEVRRIPLSEQVDGGGENGDGRD